MNTEIPHIILSESGLKVKQAIVTIISDLECAEKEILDVRIEELKAALAACNHTPDIMSMTLIIMAVQAIIKNRATELMLEEFLGSIGKKHNE